MMLRTFFCFVSKNIPFAPMNGKDEIIKKRLYFEGLKQAIETPLAGEAMNDV